MNFSLQQNLETIVRFMYQKDDIPNFSYFDSLISKITEDSISDFPELEKKREDLYKQYFKENNIPEIIINGALVTDFEKISKISHLFPTSVPSFDSPISDTKKKPFSTFKDEDTEIITDSISLLSDNLKSIVFEASDKRKSSLSKESLTSINYTYYPKIKETFKDFYCSFGKVSSEYKDIRFAIPRLFESNGISRYRDAEGNILDFNSIVTLSKDKSTSFPDRD